jgi:hypothetical protein
MISPASQRMERWSDLASHAELLSEAARVFLTLCLTVGLTTALAAGQSTGMGILSGTVSDSSGAVIAGTDQARRCQRDWTTKKRSGLSGRPTLCTWAQNLPIFHSAGS